MQHDFLDNPAGHGAEAFCHRLLSETTAALTRDYGNAGATKASIFMFVNRAFEAHLPESKIAEIFGVAVVRAGYREDDEPAAFAWLDVFAPVARAVYGAGPKS